MRRLIEALTRGVPSARLMDAEPGPAGGADPVVDAEPKNDTAATAPATEEPKGDPAATPAAKVDPKGDPTATPAAKVDPKGDPATPPSKEEPKNPAKKGDGELNLLDGGEDGDDGDQGDVQPTEEQVAEWRKGVKAIDLGDGVEFDDALLERLTPALMKLSGGDSSKAEEIVKAYTEYALEQNRKAVEQAEAFNGQLVASCRERWGKDLRRVARLADAGGKTIFGDKLWNEIRSVRQFANNPDIMERLAAFGRGAASDKGVASDRGGGRNARPVSLSEQLGI